MQILDNLKCRSCMYIQTKCIAYCKSHHFKVVWMGFSVFTYMYFSRKTLQRESCVIPHSLQLVCVFFKILHRHESNIPMTSFLSGEGCVRFFFFHFSFCKSLYLASMSADVNSTMSAVWKVDRTTKHHRPVSAKSEFCCNMYEKHVTFWVHLRAHSAGKWAQITAIGS